MADKLEVRLVFKADGTVELTTHGLQGDECLAETKQIERVIGRVITRTKTSEYHVAAVGTKANARRR